MDTQTSTVAKDHSEAIAALLHELEQFTGGDTRCWSHQFRHDLLSEGAEYLAEKAGAYWLMDLIASHQGKRILQVNDFQVWQVELLADGGCMVTCWDDTPGKSKQLVAQKVPYTDFPDLSRTSKEFGHEHFQIWAQRNHLGGVTVLMPSEY